MLLFFFIGIATGIVPCNDSLIYLLNQKLIIFLICDVQNRVLSHSVTVAVCCIHQFQRVYKIDFAIRPQFVSFNKRCT